MNNVTYDSRAVANYLLDRARSDGKHFTPMQIIKLVYLCHGWMLGIFDRPLIENPVEAWNYGPVIPNLYSAVRHYKSSAITETLPQTPDTDFGDEEQYIMDEVYRVYSDYTGPQLSTMTHRPGTPWSQAQNKGYAVIDENPMREHFREMASR